MTNTTIKLTAPQEAMLRKAIQSDGRAPAGLMDGPKRTAYKLEMLGLGDTMFHGCLYFVVNDAGRAWVAAKDDRK